MLFGMIICCTYIWWPILIFVIIFGMLETLCGKRFSYPFIFVRRWYHGKHIYWCVFCCCSLFPLKMCAVTQFIHTQNVSTKEISFARKINTCCSNDGSNFLKTVLVPMSLLLKIQPGNTKYFPYLKFDVFCHAENRIFTHKRKYFIKIATTEMEINDMKLRRTVLGKWRGRNSQFYKYRLVPLLRGIFLYFIFFVFVSFGFSFWKIKTIHKWKMECTVVAPTKE